MTTALNQFLQAHNYNKATKDTKPITHTRMPRDGSFGGCWHIPESEQELFLNLIHQAIFKEGLIEHLTETQNKDNGPLLIDLDFRYDLKDNSRFHTGETIDQLVEAIILVLNQMFAVNADYKIFFLERPHQYKDEKVVKDGIHIVVGIQTNKAMRMHFRKLFIAELETKGTLKRLPLINTLEDVVDKAVISGFSNWQMIGSRKPNRDPYKLTYFYRKL